MANKDKLLKFKQNRFKSVVESICKVRDLPLPKINFNGCPEETDEDELAHYHKDTNTICVSERELNKMTSDEIETVAAHEVSHILKFDHSSDFHKENSLSRQAHFLKNNNKQKAKFEEIKEKKINPNKCSYHLCNNNADLQRCDYCEKMFCRVHIEARPPSVGIGKEDYINENGKKLTANNSHPCIPFIKIIEEKRALQEERYNNAFKKSIKDSDK